MKKIFSVAIVAILCISCIGQNEPNKGAISQNDKKALSTVASGAVSMLGMDAVNVDKVLQEAGFVTINLNGLDNPISMPKRRHVTIAYNDSITTVVYGYNIPTNEAEYAQYMDRLNEGECYMLVQASYKENKLIGVISTFFSGHVKDINLLYTAESDKLYAMIPSKALEKSWMGMTSNDKGDTPYLSHSLFTAAVAATEYIVAEEYGGYVLNASKEGMMYICEWSHQDETQTNSGVSGIQTPPVWAIFSVYDAKYGMMEGLGGY